jgi:hypothetical protein
VNFVSSAPADISLAYVHHVREALKAACATGAISVNAPDDKFTPVFSSHDWWAADASNRVVKDLYATNNVYSSASTYSDFSNGGIEIMNGIKVFKHPSDGKYIIVYNRSIKTSEVALGVGNYWNVQYSFHGLGLKKGENGNISSIGSNPISIHGGDSAGWDYDNNAVDFATYKFFLDEAGLYPSETMLPDHLVVINAAGSNGANVMANGIYDFVLAYYNPKADGTFDGSDLSARLPSWSASGLTFDGLALPAGVSARNIGGITSANMVRKGTNTASVPTSGAGEPNDNFVGNITVPMVNYMTGRMGISSFANTNIIGDGNKWDNIISSNIQIPDITNVGLIGNYSGYAVNSTGKKIRGVMDITGIAPITIENDSINGYLNLWSVSQNMGVQKFNVVSIKDFNGIGYVNNNTISTWTGSGVPANVIIYPKKYATNTISNERSEFKPKYRAFLDGTNAQTGTPKIVPAEASFTDASYYKGTVASTSSAPTVAPLDEASWINAANANNGAAPAFVNYSAAPKLDGPNFGSIAVSAAP